MGGLIEQALVLDPPNKMFSRQARAVSGVEVLGESSAIRRVVPDALPES
jgi:hypothetical protein